VTLRSIMILSVRPILRGLQDVEAPHVLFG